MDIDERQRLFGFFLWCGTMFCVFAWTLKGFVEWAFWMVSIMGYAAFMLAGWMLLAEEN